MEEKIDLPMIFIETSHIPQNIGDSIECSVRYVNPQNPSKNFTANARLEVREKENNR